MNSAEKKLLSEYESIIENVAFTGDKLTSLRLAENSEADSRFCGYVKHLKDLAVMSAESCLFAEEMEFPDSVICLQLKNCELSPFQKWWPANLQWLEYSSESARLLITPGFKKSPLRVYCSELINKEVDALFLSLRKKGDCHVSEILDISGSVFSATDPSHFPGMVNKMPAALVLDRCDDMDSEILGIFSEKMSENGSAAACRVLSLRSTPLESIVFPFRLDGKKPIRNFVIKNTEYAEDKDKLRTLRRYCQVKSADSISQTAEYYIETGESWLDLSYSNLSEILFHVDQTNMKAFQDTTTFYV